MTVCFCLSVVPVEGDQGCLRALEDSTQMKITSSDYLPKEGDSLAGSFNPKNKAKGEGQVPLIPWIRAQHVSGEDEHASQETMISTVFRFRRNVGKCVDLLLVVRQYSKYFVTSDMRCFIGVAEETPAMYGCSA